MSPTNIKHEIKSAQVHDFFSRNNARLNDILNIIKLMKRILNNPDYEWQAHYQIYE